MVARGIRLRLLVPILGATTVALGVAAYVQHVDALNRLRAGRDAEVAATLERLGHLLPAAVEDLDTELMRNALRGELAGVHIGSLAIRLGERELVRVARPGLDPGDDQAQRVVHPLSLHSAGVEPAAIAVITDPAPLREAIQAALWQGLAMVLAVDALVALAVWLVVTQVTAPITRLTTAARSMADGRLDQPMEIQGQDEVGELARSFERMRIAIRATIATIEAQNCDLDARVRERSRQLEQAQAELLEAANLAGKAELATGVLHNIGNVLTGVFVDLEMLRQTATPELQTTIRALQEVYQRLPDGAALVRHLEEDPQRSGLPRLTGLVLADLLAEESSRRALHNRLEEHLTMIRDIVSLQQAHAVGAHFVQAIDLRRVMEDMLLLHAMGLRQRGVTVTTRCADIPPIRGDRVKVSHILANLVKNAQDALALTEGSLRRLIVTIEAVDNPPGCTPGPYAELRLEDTGCGIRPEDQGRLFTHGFTTKVDGHGFGLHACANAMADMGGDIRIDSPGPGSGTTVTLHLPLMLESGDPTSMVRS